MPRKRTPSSRHATETPVSSERRDVLIGAAAMAAGIAGFAPERADASTEVEENAALQLGDRFEIVRGPMKGELLRADMLTAGEKPVECFPVDAVTGAVRRGNRLNRTLALKLDPTEMADATRALSVDGVLVYSAVCTHKGCTIKSWKDEERILRCHCHLSEFAALDGGRVMRGPAMHQLPMAPLGVDDDGFVVATAGFTEEPGGKTK